MGYMIKLFCTIILYLITYKIREKLCDWGDKLKEQMGHFCNYLCTLQNLEILSSSTRLAQQVLKKKKRSGRDIKIKNKNIEWSWTCFDNHADFTKY
jgi:hypothetical protein